MKYCNKCGMLLEDTHERCIGCGADVSYPGSYSFFPPTIEETIIKEKAEEKKRGGIIILLIVVSVLLVTAVVGFIIFTNANMSASPEDYEEEEYLDDEEEEEDITEEDEELDAEDAESELTDSFDFDIVSNESKEEEEPVVDKTVVKDDKGSYYYTAELTDAAGNVVFSTVYPEDFSPVLENVKTDEYSTKFPERITYIVGNDDNNARFTYLSTQHFWHRDSKKGKSRTNERNIKDYMTYFAYDKAQGYIEAHIKQSYKDIKGFKLVKTEAVDDDMVSYLSDFSMSHSKTLTSLKGDYAHIGEDTMYAAMAADYEANIYSYEATTRQNNTIFMDFYVPVIANTLSYSSDKENDMGNVIEWFPIEFIAFEAGNEELHDLYKDAFKMFIYNSHLSKEFFYDNEQYSNEIKAAVSDNKEPAPLTENKLKSYHEDYNGNIQLSSFYDGIYKFVTMTPASRLKYENADMSVMCTSNIQTAYYNPDTNKLFVSPDATEYPGEAYSELETEDSPIEEDEAEEPEEPEEEESEEDFPEEEDQEEEA